MCKRPLRPHSQCKGVAISNIFWRLGEVGGVSPRLRPPLLHPQPGLWRDFPQVRTPPTGDALAAPFRVPEEPGEGTGTTLLRGGQERLWGGRDGETLMRK